MIDFERKEHYGLSDLLRIVALLRSEDGCPWDRVQTHASLRRSLLEEAYEAAEAIDREDPALLKEELGDLLLQVVFHADIERQAGDFTMDDVADGEVRKMLFRHPHVFGGQETVQDADTVLEGWEAIKRRTVANDACDNERVMVNGRVQRASYDVKPGDRIAIRFGQRTLEVEVLTVADNVGKAEAAAMYREIMDSPS